MASQFMITKDLQSEQGSVAYLGLVAVSWPAG
jgi:hypothetical protein